MRSKLSQLNTQTSCNFRIRTTRQAIWREDLAETRPVSCLRAAQCALELQDRLGGYSATEALLDDGSESLLSIKISLGYGNVTAFHVGVSRVDRFKWLVLVFLMFFAHSSQGERNRFEFFMAGMPLLQVTLAEHQAQAGESLEQSKSNTPKRKKTCD